MKLGVMGDLHLRYSVPKERTDDYPQVLLNKFSFILDFCDKHKISCLIQPGDFFDSVSPSIDLIRYTAKLLSTHTVKVYVVYGQHDLRYHLGSTNNTPLRLLEDFNLVKRLPFTDGVLLSRLEDKKRVVAWGSSWNEEIPTGMNPDDINIWATHRMVIDSKKLWDGQKEYTLAKHLLRKNSFNLIVTGDNHRSFITKYGLRWLVNCGSLGRPNIDQTMHIPHFVVYDTETRKIARVKVPVKSAKEVLRVEEVKERKKKEAELAQFVTELESVVKVKKRINYKDIVWATAKKMKDDTIIHMIEKIFLAAESKEMKLTLGETE